jgi:cytidylate kinase
LQTVIIAVAGPMGVGKTTMCQALAGRLGWPSVSFGDFVRAEAMRRGLPNTRDELQRLGQELVRAPEELVGAVVRGADRRHGQGIVVDGVRHIAIVRALRDIGGRRFALFFLDAPRSVRLERWAQRGKTLEEYERAERHPVEAELPRVRASADWVVDASPSSEAVVDTMLALFAGEAGPKSGWPKAYE